MSLLAHLLTVLISFYEDDTPLSNGHGQTISAPHMHAHVLEELIEPLIIHASQKPGEALSILDGKLGDSNEWKNI